MPARRAREGRGWRGRNLPAIMVLLVLIEGLAIYLNQVAHPGQEPNLTVIIVAVTALAVGLGTWYMARKGML